MIKDMAVPIVNTALILLAMLFGNLFYNHTSNDVETNLGIIYATR